MFFIAQAVAGAPKKFENRRIGEFRRAAETAVDRIDIIGEIRCQSVGERQAEGRGARRGWRYMAEGLAHGLGILGNFTLLVMKGFRDAAQHGNEGRPAIARFFWKIGSAPEWFATRGQEQGHRPAAMFAESMQRLHIDVVDIRPFLAIDLDVHEKLVHDRGGLSIFETFMGHDMAPMAGGIADGQQDRLVGGLRFCQRRGAPEAPVDGVVLMLEQIGASGLGEFVGHDGP